MHMAAEAPRELGQQAEALIKQVVLVSAKHADEIALQSHTGHYPRILSASAARAQPCKSKWRGAKNLSRCCEHTGK